jgi:IS605 OrfB family transposase
MSDTQFLTATLKLFAPSKRKLATLRRAALAVTEARVAAMAATETLMRELAGAGEERKDRLRRLARVAIEAIRPYRLPTSLSAGVLWDVRCFANSFAALKADYDPGAQIPNLTPREDGYAHGLDMLQRAMTQEEFAAAIAKMNQRGRDGVRPFTLTRWRRNDGFLILFNGAGRWFAWLPVETRQSDTIVADGNALFDLRTGQEVTRLKLSRGVLCPLQFGQYQEDLLRRGVPRSAVVSLKGEEVSLYVAVEVTCTSPVDLIPGRIVGVHRGRQNLATIAVVRDGQPVLIERASGTTLRQLQRKEERYRSDQQRRGTERKPPWRRHRVRRYSQHVVHDIVNRIVDLARTERALVVFEDLDSLKRSPNRHGIRKGMRSERDWYINSLLSRQVFGRIERTIAYKLALAGLPRVWTVSLLHERHICPKCRQVAAGNRWKSPLGEFQCTHCGHTGYADEAAAIEIARRGEESSRRARARRADAGQVVAARGSATGLTQ